MTAPDRSPSPQERVTKLAKDVQDAHKYLLDALRDAQPLALLASLSLVIAAFSQNVSQAAIGYAVSASVAFLTSLIFSMVVPPAKGAKTLQSIPWSGAAIISLILGFFMLYEVIFEFIAKFPVASGVFRTTQAGLSLLTWTVLAFSAFGWVSGIRVRNPKRWSRLHVPLLIAEWIVLASIPVSLLVFVASSLFGPVPDWLTLPLFSAPGAAVIFIVVVHQSTRSTASTASP